CSPLFSYHHHPPSFPTRRSSDLYFIVSFEPRLPSSHSMCAPSCTSARWVTRLYMLCDQFWIVTQRNRAFGLTMISITPEWNESVEYDAAVHPSMYCAFAPSSTMISDRSNW